MLTARQCCTTFPKHVFPRTRALKADSGSQMITTLVSQRCINSLEVSIPGATYLGFLSLMGLNSCPSWVSLPESCSLSASVALGLPLAPDPGIWRLGTSLGPLGLAEELTGGMVVIKGGVTQGCLRERKVTLEDRELPEGQLSPGPSEPG